MRSSPRYYTPPDTRRRGSPDIESKAMQKHLDLSERSIRDLLALLQGQIVKKNGRKLYGIRGADDKAFLKVENRGPNSNRFTIHKPLVEAE
jgi:hypothetical protein